VDVGVDHDVDVLGCDAGGAQTVGEVGVQVVELGDLGSVTVVADAGVDQHGHARSAHHPGLDRRPVRH